MTSSIQTRLQSLEQDNVTLSSLARPGRWAFVSKWRRPMPNFRLLWRQFLGIECTSEAETSLSYLCQYKVVIGNDKQNTLFGPSPQKQAVVGLLNADAWLSGPAVGVFGGLWFFSGSWVSTFAVSVVESRSHRKLLKHRLRWGLN